MTLHSSWAHASSTGASRNRVLLTYTNDCTAKALPGEFRTNSKGREGGLGLQESQQAEHCELFTAIPNSVPPTLALLAPMVALADTNRTEKLTA